MSKIKLNARGTIIEVDEEILKKSEVIQVWSQTIMKTNEESFDLNYSPSTVHYLIDYLSDIPIPLNKIENVAEFLQIPLNDNKPIEDKINKLEENLVLKNRIRSLEDRLEKNNWFCRIVETLLMCFERQPLETMCWSFGLSMLYIFGFLFAIKFSLSIFK